MNLSTLDLSVVAIYAVVLLVLAQWVSREKAGHEKDSSDYFLAGRNLGWFIVGASRSSAAICAQGERRTKRSNSGILLQAQ